MNTRLAEILKEIPPIRLDEMDGVALLNRVDTKFIFHKNKLNKILKRAAVHYKILEIDDNRISTYKNLYYDTKDLKFYNDHHNGKKNRVKVRMRKYLETDVCYLEVKQKNNKGRTDKIRQKITGFEINPSSKAESLFGAMSNEYGNLNPVLWNEFKRVTLVSLKDNERVTLDIELSSNFDGNPVSFDELVIAEIKQAEFTRGTAFFKLLKSLRINPYRISKYCIGMTTVNQNLKYNNFKEKIRRINKITNL